MFFTDEDDRPVQLRATYSSAHPWQWPGGVAEAGERPWETAVRECREETGLRVAGLRSSWPRYSGCPARTGRWPRSGSCSTAAGSPPGSSPGSCWTRTSTITCAPWQCPSGRS
ncbi:NUDIX hydrolase [Streptomyces sp. NPDC048352]|uniref:NUDIX hydrolase n=1 Tax=Streptomyces sp. NPDC048352 TaxID=3154718 RepID=UPI00341A3A74